MEILDGINCGFFQNSIICLGSLGSENYNKPKNFALHYIRKFDFVSL
jgi:hypothetical protein